MQKEQIVSIINEQVKPLGFKKRGGQWTLESDSLVKVINLQKSNFGDLYYINYGLIIRAIPLDGLKMHIYQRLGSQHVQENLKILELLNLENEIDDESRSAGLRSKISENLLSYLNKFNTEDDVLCELRAMVGTNNVPLIVKKYFMLE